MARPKQSIPWLTKDKREIPISELGDQHLVWCLQMTENELRIYGAGKEEHQLRSEHLRQYPALVAEAQARGLFQWSPERKYLPEILTLCADTLADRDAAKDQRHRERQRRIKAGYVPPGVKHPKTKS